MSDDDDSKRQLALRIVQTFDQDTREALLHWVIRLTEIRASDESTMTKVKQTFEATLSSDIIWPVAKLIASEVYRLGWATTGMASKAGMSVGALALLLFGGQSAGIAALGGAIGVPLWLVFGAGASFLVLLYQALTPGEAARDPAPTKAAASIGDIVEVQAVEVPQHAAALTSLGVDQVGVGDAIRCKACGTSRVVSQLWIDQLSARVRPEHRFKGGTLDSTILTRMTCKTCGSKAAEVFRRVQTGRNG